MRDSIICYDIRDAKRLGRIHRYLTRHAIALQYSVFLFQGTNDALNRCLDDLSALMDPAQDDIRAYPLPASGYRCTYGALPLSDDIHFDALPAPWAHTIDTPDQT